MKINELLSQLFPEGHQVKIDDWLVEGRAMVGGKPVCVLGTTNSVAIGVRECLRLAHGLLDIVRSQPPQPIIMLVDNQGQRMALGEELLVLPEYIGHLLQCQQLARNQGYPLIAIVYGNSVAGGFLAFGLGADRVVAIEGASTSVMKLEAIARVTKVPLKQLEERAATSPIFAPGCNSFYKLGGLHAIWKDNFSDNLLKLLSEDLRGDNRIEIGHERGGRLYAKQIVERVLHA